MATQQKVGVLTFHRCINYGSYWQARCLVEGLQAAGMDAVVLDYDSPAVRRAEWRCALWPHLPEPPVTRDLPHYAAKTRRCLAAIDALPLSEPFGFDDPDQDAECDVVVVGSDEVWNLNHPWYGGMPVFYGEGLRTPRLVSYAASFGSQHAAHPLPQYWTQLLRRFEAISVRDENSARLIGEALEVEPALVLDPCLQFPQAVPRRGSASEKPYVAVYGHSFPDWFARAARETAQDAGLRLISIGYRNAWTDEQRIEVGPEEFARLMAGAAAVATNFFHGCVFALLLGKPFGCVASDYRANKVLGLLDMLGARRHLASDDQATFAELLSEPPDPAIATRIAMLRRRSGAYLAAALRQDEAADAP